MDSARRQYEATFIVNASLDDPQVDAVIGRVQEQITKNGGTVAAINKWGRKRLAYPINKKANGFYVNMEFEGPGALVAPLERAFRLDELVLRHITLVLDRRALKARAAAATAAAAAAAAPTPAEPAAPVSTREPLFKEPENEKKG
jgi:small subunit ribosomal protein S6